MVRVRRRRPGRSDRKGYTVRDFYRARTLAGRMAIDRGLILQTDASPA